LKYLGEFITGKDSRADWIRAPCQVLRSASFADVCRKQEATPIPLPPANTFELLIQYDNGGNNNNKGEGLKIMRSHNSQTEIFNTPFIWCSLWFFAREEHPMGLSLLSTETFNTLL
jgi:hypothetical protein